MFDTKNDPFRSYFGYGEEVEIALVDNTELDMAGSLTVTASILAILAALTVF